jgi:hypothetical protein
LLRHKREDGDSNSPVSEALGSPGHKAGQKEPSIKKKKRVRKEGRKGGRGRKGKGGRKG